MGKRLIKIILFLVVGDLCIAGATMSLLALRLPYDVEACAVGFFCFPPTLVYGFITGLVFTLAYIPISIYLLSRPVQTMQGVGLNSVAVASSSWIPVVVYIVFGLFLPLGMLAYNMQSWLSHGLSDIVWGALFLISTLAFWGRAVLTLRMKAYVIACTIGMFVLLSIQYYLVKLS